MEIKKIRVNGKEFDVSGESAYETAVRNGFVGTEAEWLASLKGEKGEKGEAGLADVVVQTTGESETDVMSQKAVSNLFDKVLVPEEKANATKGYDMAYAKIALFFDEPIEVEAFTPDFKIKDDTFYYAIVEASEPVISEAAFPTLTYLQEGTLNCGDAIPIKRTLSSTVGIIFWANDTNNRVMMAYYANAIVPARYLRYQTVLNSQSGKYEMGFTGLSWGSSYGGVFTFKTSKTDDLSNRIDQQDAEIEGLKANVDEVRTKRPVSTFAVIGDSYSTYSGWISEGNVPWYKDDGTQSASNDVASVKDTWWWQFSKEKRISLLRNESYSGSCVCNVAHGAGAENSFINRAKRHLCEGNTAGAKPDLIFILGGINDMGATTEGKTTLDVAKYEGWTEEDLTKIAPAYCYLIDHLMTYNPRAQIVCIIPYNISNPMKAMIREVCDHYGLQYVDFPSDVGMAASHPNKAGMARIKDVVIEALTDI